MKNFELFMGCLGNGITVCNKAIEKNGDYKTIAHIAENGNIKFYTEPGKIPGKDLLKIEHTANVQYEKFKKWLYSLPEARRYQFLLDRMKHDDFMSALRMNGNMADKIAYLETKFYQMHY